MAAIEKNYQLNPAFLLNAIYDVAEMRKAKVIGAGENGVELETEMYGIKTLYSFRLSCGQAGTALSVESEGDMDVMFALLESIIDPLAVRYPAVKNV
jgi:hypothetical protein